MNRMWVRLSLAFTAVVIIVMMIIGTIFRSNFDISGNPDVPPEVIAYFESVSTERFPLDFTTTLGIVGLVAIAAGVWMSRSLTAPLDELGKAAEDISQKELSRRVPIRGSQEVQALSTQFNEMAAALETAEHLRRQLLADVAHELRHPIHILQGNLQAMLDDVYPLTKEEICRLSDQTHHLAALVNDLRELAQADANQLPLHKHPTNMAELVKSTVADFKAEASTKNIKLQVALEGKIPVLSVDASRIRQILSNLLANALRHTPADGHISVTATAVSDTFTIRVTDDGNGIAPDQLPHLFDRFYRTDAARRRDEGGTGLGLAIANATAAAHDGSLVASSPGLNQGSTFTLTLPIQ